MRLLSAFVLLLGLCAGCFGTDVVLVAPAGLGVYETVLRIALQKIAETPSLSTSYFSSPLNITTVWESGASPLQDLELVRPLSQRAKLAVIASSNPTIAFTFGSANVPTILLWPSTIIQPMPNAISLSLQLDMKDCLIDVFRNFQWTSTALVYAPSFESVQSSFRTALTAGGVSVTVTTLLDLSFPSTTVASIVTSLERSSSRVVVVVSSAAEFQYLLRHVRETAFEFVWLDPLSTLSAHDRFSDSFINGTSAIGMPRGFIAIEANPISANATLVSRFYGGNQINSSSVEPGYASLMYDSVFLWANAIKSIADASGNLSDGALVAQAIRNSSGELPGLITGTFSFDSNTGRRSGDLAILNFRWSGSGTSYASNWTTVGKYSGATSTRQSGQLFLPAGSTLFASGSATLPSSQQQPSITIGLLWATLRPVHAAWRRVVTMALEDINANSSIVPGRVVRAVFVDNLDSAASTINGASELISRGVIGILGPSRSTQSIALQYYIGGLRVPNIGHSSTADVLSDKLNFPTFFRTVIRDSFQSRAIVSFMEKNGWRNLCLINFADDYGTGVAQGIVAQAAGKNMTIMARTSFTTTNLNVNETLGATVQAGCRIIAFVPDANTFFPMMRGAKALGIFGRPEYVWIFSESIASDLNTARITNQSLTPRDFQGTFITRPLDGPPTSPLYQNYSSRIRARAADLGFISDTPVFGGQLYDAVWTYAIAAGNLIRAGVDPLVNRNDFLTSIKQTSFSGVTGPVGFDSNQDRIGASLGVYNFLADLGAVQLIGVYSETQGVEFSQLPIFYDNTTVIPPDRLPIPEASILFSAGGPAVITAFTVLVFFLVVITAVIVMVFRTNKLIHRSSPVFLLMILLGVLCAAISILFWFGHPTEALCHLRVWFGFLGAATAYGALLAKNWRLYYLFNEPSMRVVAIRNSHLFVVLSLVLTPMAIVLVLWSSLMPFRVTNQLNAARDFNYATCTSANDRIFAPIAFSYMFLAMVVGAFLSFKTRTLPDTFNESKYIALSTYNLLFVSAVGILIGYILAFEPTAFTFIIPVCILFGCLTTWGLLFVPKLWLLFFRRSQIEGTDPPGRRTGSGGRSGRSGRGTSATRPPFSDASNRSMVDPMSVKSEIPMSSMIVGPSEMSTRANQGSVVNNRSMLSRVDYDVDISASMSSAANESDTSGMESPTRGSSMSSRPYGSTLATAGDHSYRKARPKQAVQKKPAVSSSSSSSDSDDSSSASSSDEESSSSEAPQPTKKSTKTKKAREENEKDSAPEKKDKRKK